VVLRPSLKISTDPSDRPQIVIEQWKKWMLQKPSDALLGDAHFRFDTVDITRAALTEIFAYAYDDVKTSCKANSKLPDTCGFFKTAEIPGKIKKNIFVLPTGRFLH